MSAARRLLLAAAGGAVGLVVPSVEVVTSAPSGGWSFFQDPRTLAFGGWTYFGYTRGDNGDVAVRAIDPAGTVGSAVTLHAALSVDDHSAPSFLVRDSDHKLMAFYCGPDDTTMRLRVSTTSLDTDPDLSDGFGSEVSLDSDLAGTIYTYSQPMQLTGETNDPIYLLYREDVDYGIGQSWWALGKSEDDGASWTSETLVTHTNRRIYMQAVASGGDRIDFAVSNHPFHQSDSSVWHFYYDGTFRQSDGTSMGSPPFDQDDLTPVYFGSTDRAWVWDIAMSDDGPVIAYVAFDDYPDDHRYRQARWNGSAWVGEEIVAGGDGIAGGDSADYSGGINLDPASPHVAYLSKQDGSDWHVWRYVRSGVTWTGTQLTTSGKNVRPVAVSGGAFRVLCLTGTYTQWDDYSQGVSGWG